MNWVRNLLLIDQTLLLLELQSLGSTSPRKGRDPSQVSQEKGSRPYLLEWQGRKIPYDVVSIAGALMEYFLYEATN
jgi:hypothetical protein